MRTLVVCYYQIDDAFVQFVPNCVSGFVVFAVLFAEKNLLLSKFHTVARKEIDSVYVSILMCIELRWVVSIWEFRLTKYKNKSVLVIKVIGYGCRVTETLYVFVEKWENAQQWKVLSCEL